MNFRPKPELTRRPHKKIANPWLRLLTTTTPKPKVPFGTNVTVFQFGNFEMHDNGQLEVTGSICLVRDDDFLLLVDTGSPSDAERLLHCKYRSIFSFCLSVFLFLKSFP